MENSNSKEDKEERLLDVAISNIAHDMERVGSIIDSFTSAKLKRVLKLITHVSLAEEILTGKTKKLKEDEQSLIDKILRLQENILGYTQLKKEQGEKDE